MSSGVEQQGDDEEVCASCGKAAVNNVKLKLCTACKLVKYCSVECQKNHRPQHKKACKKRMAEIRDDRLFTQPDETYLGECPICCLAHSLDITQSMINSCCGKIICDGCDYANKIREEEQGLEHKCPFCREPKPETDEEAFGNLMERMKANDPVALNQLGKTCYHEGDYEGAFQYYTKAAKLGDIEVHWNLAGLYGEGQGVEKDEKKAVYHLEEAAIGGHPSARHNLGCEEKEKGRIDRALKHWIIAANLGHDEALAMVKQGFQIGDVSKEEYASSLRGHQAAVDATKSTQREEAEKAKQ